MGIAPSRQIETTKTPEAQRLESADYADFTDSENNTG
jgi:hypothetical protein